MKSKYSTTLCLLCGAYIAKGAEIRKVGGAWVHGRCPRHDYTIFSAPAKVGPKRSNTVSDNNQQAAVAAPQYATKAQFDKVAAYVLEMARQFNELEKRVIELERREEAHRNHENQQPGVGRNKTNPKFQGRDAALEAEAS
jgi:hypothetical protein